MSQMPTRIHIAKDEYPHINELCSIRE